MSMVMSLFTIPTERGKALGFWSASAPAGGTAGVFLGGIITAYVDWSWVFLINVPVGIAVLALTWMLLPRGIPVQRSKRSHQCALPRVEEKEDTSRDLL
jgi:MFS family permease